MAVPFDETEEVEEGEVFPIEDSSIVTKKEVSSVSIIIFSVIIAVLLSATYILFSFSLPGLLGKDIWLALTARTFVLLLIGLFIPYAIAFFFIFRFAGSFFHRFYNPPEGANPRELIVSRLYGYGPFVPIRNERLLPQP